MTLVLDASVVAKWLFHEADRASAEALLEGWADGRWEVVAPEILVAEVASAIWKRTRREGLPTAEAFQLFERFETFCPTLVSIENLVRSALDFAVQYGCSVYDGLYVALARSLPCPFITADEKLHRSLSASYPEVHLLRDWA
jgi:predicted nucleic acid-binding protein